LDQPSARRPFARGDGVGTGVGVTYDAVGGTAVVGATDVVVPDPYVGTVAAGGTTVGSVMNTMPWTWLGMTTNASVSMPSKWSKAQRHWVSTMIPKSFSSIRPLSVSPRCSTIPSVQIVTK